MDHTTQLLTFFTFCMHVTSGQDNVVFSLMENMGPGYFVGNIARQSNILQNVSSADREKIRYSYLNENPNSDYFVLEGVSGNLTTSKTVIDREEVCKFSVECIIEFDVTVLKASFLFAIVPVTIVILDDNDNTPTFTKTHIDLDISEEETVGEMFRFDGAFDKDMGVNNSIQSYTIEQSEDTFDLLVTNDDSVRLRLKQKLDREIQSNYSVTVIASDGGNPVKRGYLHINVNVLDENDNAPMFTSDGYNVTIYENVSLNTVILNLSASDPDLGANSELAYHISARQSNIDTINRIFSLNAQTGALSVITNLIYESDEHYEFSVEVNDNGVDPLKNKTVVVVNVKDAGNNPPVIHINLLLPGNISSVNISENEPVGSFVAHVDVEDNDKGLNGQFTCSVKHKFFKLERFLGKGYKVVVNGVLDREEIDEHNVTITCHDMGTTPMTSSDSFLVRVLDVNDERPVFVKNVFEQMMNENNDLIDIVTTVSATDGDIGDNGRFEYKIHEEANGRFIIDSSNGIIYVNDILDRETEPIIVFRVLAVDFGSPRLTGTATVSLTLIDENDNAPLMIPARPDFRVLENLPPFVTVGFLHAHDNDTGQNSDFTFSIAPVSKQFPFVVYPDGEIRTNKSLDREEHSRYDIPIRVTDKGNTPLSSVHYIAIFVADENDNIPQVTFPNDENKTVRFLYPVKDYNVVTSIAAYDVDEAENMTLIFDIVGGNDQGIFEIDQNLGEISILTTLDMKTDISVTLTIEVRDKGPFSKPVLVDLIIDLLYANATASGQADEGSGSKYVIISVVIVLITAVFVVAIVAIIMFLRSLDRNKAEAEDAARYSDSGISCRSDSHSLQAEGERDEADGGKSKRKKEVSFSLEFSNGLDGGRNVESTTDNDNTHSRLYDGAPPTGQHQAPMYPTHRQEKIDRHMKALKLQQFLLEAKARDWDSANMQVQPQLPLGDSESETSRDTNTCDSGRGGSEDDVSTASPTNADGKRTFSFPVSKLNQKQVPFHHHPCQQPKLQDYVTSSRAAYPDNYGKAPPRPPSYHPNDIYRPSTNHITNTHRPSQYDMGGSTYNHTPSYNNTYSGYSGSKLDNWRHSYPRGGVNLPHVRHDSCSSIRSNDDDGGSTTTSGSYTLEPEDIDVDAYPPVRDLVV